MSDQHSLTPGFRQQKLRLEVFRQRRGQNSASFQKRFGIFRLAVSSDRITQFEPQKTKQKQRAALIKCNPVQIGWKKEQYSKQNLIINYELFLEYREKILIMRECLKLIKNLTATEMTI